MFVTIATVALINDKSKLRKSKAERDGRCYGAMERGWEVLWRGGGRCF